MTPQLSRRLVLSAPALLLAGRARAVTLNEAALTQGGFVVAAPRRALGWHWMAARSGSRPPGISPLALGGTMRPRPGLPLPLLQVPQKHGF